MAQCPPSTINDVSTMILADKRAELRASHRVPRNLLELYTSFDRISMRIPTWNDQRCRPHQRADARPDANSCSQVMRTWLLIRSRFRKSINPHPPRFGNATLDYAYVDLVFWASHDLPLLIASRHLSSASFPVLTSKSTPHIN